MKLLLIVFTLPCLHQENHHKAKAYTAHKELALWKQASEYRYGALQKSNRFD